MSGPHATGAASVAIEWDMFHPDDARALHDAGIAVRTTFPRPERIAARRQYGFNDQSDLMQALSAGLIDVLAGDDTEFVAGLVRDASFDRSSTASG